MSTEINHKGETGSGSTDELTSASDNQRQNDNQPFNWKKFADETMEGYLTRCPGAHGENTQLSSVSENATGRADDNINVSSNCYKYNNM